MQCEHIIIPEAHLALITLKSCHKTQLECDRIIHAERFLRESISSVSATLRFNRKLIKELMAEAINALSAAKATHDKLEKLYAEAMDFASLEKFCESFAASLI